MLTFECIWCKERQIVYAGVQIESDDHEDDVNSDYGNDDYMLNGLK